MGYIGTDGTNALTRNWSGEVSFNPQVYRSPASLPSLVEVVAAATEQGKSIHAIGSGWAFEDCAKTDGVMVSLSNLNSQLTNVLAGGIPLTQHWQSIQSYGPNQLVHYEAGILLTDLCDSLDQVGLALPTLGGSRGQSLAGAMSTSTHGGDWQQTPLPEIVRAVHLVTTGGQEVWIESATAPLTRPDGNDSALRSVLPCNTTLIIRDDNVFNAVRVACGRFGVIYSVVLEVRPQFRVVQVVTKPSLTDVMVALRAGQGTPSVFTPLFRLLNDIPLPAGYDDAKGVPYFLQVLFNSQRPSDVWATRRWEAFIYPDDAIVPKGSQNALAVAMIAIANAALLGVAGIAGGIAYGTAAALESIVLGPLGAFFAGQYGISTSFAIIDMVNQLDSLLIQGNAPFGSLIAAAVNALYQVPGASFAIPQISGMVIEGNVDKNQRGKHYLVTTGAKEDSFQNDFRSDSIEVIFDATTSGYIDFLDDVMAVGPSFAQCGYISLRPCLRSSCLLSMHNVNGARAISIEIASFKNLSGNAAWMAYVHQAAIRYNGRPHWGQYNKLDASTVSMLYGDALNQWRDALLRVAGSSPAFSNAFTRQRGLEPLGVVREVTCVTVANGKVTYLGNGGQYWSPVTVAQAIQDILSSTVRYVLRQGDTRIPIAVVADGQGGSAPRAPADPKMPDNLVNLQPCHFIKKTSKQPRQSLRPRKS
jgi:FAD/FMN-containing dehydrogenase